MRICGCVLPLWVFAALLTAPIAFGSDFQINRLVDTTMPVPGGVFGNFTSVSLLATDGPNVAFIGSFSSGANNYSGLYQYHGGQIDTLADLTVPAPSGGNFQQVLAGNDYINDNLVFGAATASGIGIFRYSSTGLHTIVAPGTVLPGSGGTLATLEAKGVSGDANSSGFAGTNSDGKGVLFATVNSQLSFLADDETHVPGIELGVFHSFPEIHARAGKVLFVGTALDPDAGETLYEPAGLFYNLPDGTLQSIVTRSTIIPDEPEFYFKEFENPRIGGDGRYYFTGGFLDKEEGPRARSRTRGVRGTPPDHFMGVFAVDQNGEIETLADSEMALPGLQAEIEEFNRYSFDGGARVFGVVDALGATYLYVEDPEGSFRHVIDSTEMLDGKQLTSVKMTLDPTSAGVTSFRAVFADGSSGIYSFAVPEPASCATLAAAGALALLRRRRHGA